MTHEKIIEAMWIKHNLQISLFIKMGTMIDSPHEEGTFSDYRILEDKYWSILTFSIPSSVTRARGSSSEPGILLHSMARMINLQLANGRFPKQVREGPALRAS